MKLNTVICGKAEDVLKTFPNGCIDLILTDPPYPDYYEEEYQYRDGILDILKKFSCKQLIFWSAKVDFPLNYTAIHIWDKKCGVGSMYERIFERNGGKNYRVFGYYLINSSVAAKYTGDIFTGHKSQKPIKLIKKLVEEHTKKGDTVLDPFLGSGTTAVACKELGRNYIGIEISPEYCKIAENRLAQGVLNI